MNQKKYLLYALIVLVVLTGRLALAADGDLTQEDRRQKRLKYNRYFEEELAKAELELSKKRFKPWNVHAEVYYGYDNNTTLDSEREGDLFHENYIEAKLTDFHEGLIGLFGEGEYGVAFESEYLGYFAANDFDYHNMALRPFLESSLGGTARLELEYELSAVRYIRDNQLNYIGQAIGATLKDELAENVEHRLIVNYQNKEYSDRAALAPTGLASASDREDRYLDVGYGLDILWDEGLLGFSAAWKLNDSNDQDRDFNDYSGWRVGSYYFYRPLPKMSFILAGGFDFTQYDKRTFADDESTETERDNYFYLTGQIYYEMNPTTQLSLSYLYNENGSNDADQEYSGSTIKIGLVCSL